MLPSQKSKASNGNTILHPQTHLQDLAEQETTSAMMAAGETQVGALLVIQSDLFIP